MRTDGSDQFLDTSSPLSCPDTNNKADQHPQASNPGILAWSDSKELRQHLRPPGRCNAPLGGSSVQLHYLSSSLWLAGFLDCVCSGTWGWSECSDWRVTHLSFPEKEWWGKTEPPSRGEKFFMNHQRLLYFKKLQKPPLGFYVIVLKNLSWLVSFLWLPKRTHIFPSTLVANLL